MIVFEFGRILGILFYLKLESGQDAGGNAAAFFEQRATFYSVSFSIVIVRAIDAKAVLSSAPSTLK